MLSISDQTIYLTIVLIILEAVFLLIGITLSEKPPSLIPFLMYIHIKFLHKWVGYSLTVLVTLHHVFHMDWIKAMTKKKITTKKST
jgi:hypothetical protein